MFAFSCHAGEVLAVGVTGPNGLVHPLQVSGAMVPTVTLVVPEAVASTALAADVVHVSGMPLRLRETVPELVAETATGEGAGVTVQVGAATPAVAVVAPRVTAAAAAPAVSAIFLRVLRTVSSSDSAVRAHCCGDSTRIPAKAQGVPR